VKAELTPTARGGDRMLAAEALAVSAGGRELLRDCDLLCGWGERIAIIGANGSGKTTLLRALVGEHALDAGTITTAPSTRIGYLPQDEAQAPDAARTPVEIIRSAAALSETDARRFLHRFLFSGDGALTPVGRLSYGERRRLALAQLVLGGANLLLLDEPTNHLDIPSREAFESALDAYDGAMIAVTHDRYFIDRFADRVLLVGDARLRESDAEASTWSS
jgi:ATP-binding cassette subfamily F protein 3